MRVRASVRAPVKSTLFKKKWNCGGAWQVGKLQLASAGLFKKKWNCGGAWQVGKLQLASAGG
jgi:hypothetical protein